MITDNYTITLTTAQRFLEQLVKSTSMKMSRRHRKKVKDSETSEYW